MPSNTWAPFGFRWHGLYGDSAAPTSGLLQMKIAAADTVTCGEGDPLLFKSTGYVGLYTRGTVASQFGGVFKSCSYFDTGQGRRVWRNYWPGGGATGDISVQVQAASGAPAPRFLVQSSGAAAVTMGNVWNNVDVTYSTGTLVTGGYYRSGAMIDLAANIGTTSSLPFRIVGLWSDISPKGAPGADTASAYNWVLVEANNIQATGI